MPKRIVYTRLPCPREPAGGGVAVCAPSPAAMAYMTGGGGRWDDILRWDREFLDRQIAAQARHGVGERAAARFVYAMQWGGLTTAEAYGVMRDRFCAHLGTGCELWDTADVPTDRTYRDAWRRSHNGGPIYVHMPAARRVQWERIKAGVEARNRPLVALGFKPYVPRWGELHTATKEARDDQELRRVWPEELQGATLVTVAASA